ncbi:unnamed protein product [Vitrella brassicaformis CCMP3155]|uniref:Uncharacterized protein n=2 Tax=Vitrella brassicaformis TaxID=1169539 RepID=A0A0G4FHR6_VITBC|nr:unnamed protein product [Vitrella brassicaformis CCMP3155]|eukprot:CEM13010.1 unnamed protein product [Vitrella brassicaformis CCMP3155]
MYEAVYGVFTVVSFTHPNQGKLIKINQTFVHTAVIVVPREIQTIKAQFMAFCVRRLGLYASQLTAVVIVDPVKRQKKGSGGPAVPIALPLLPREPWHGLVMDRLASLHIESAGGLAVFELLQLNCPAMRRLTGRLADPDTYRKKRSEERRSTYLNNEGCIRLDDSLASFCRRHTQLTHIDIFPLIPNHLTATLTAMRRLTRLTHLGHFLVPLTNCSTYGTMHHYQKTWPECRKIMSLLSSIEQQKWHDDDSRRQAKKDKDGMADADSESETTGGSRTLVLHIPIVLDLSLPSKMTVANASEPVPLRLMSEAEEWGWTVVRKGGCDVIDCTEHPNSPHSAIPHMERKERFEAMNKIPPALLRHLPGGDEAMLLTPRTSGRSLLSEHPSLRCVHFPGAKVLRVKVYRETDYVALQSIPSCICEPNVFENIEEVVFESMDLDGIMNGFVDGVSDSSPPPFDNHLCRLLQSLPSGLKIDLSPDIGGMMLECVAYYQGGGDDRRVASEVAAAGCGLNNKSLSAVTELSSAHGLLPPQAERRNRYPRIEKLTIDADCCPDLDEVAWLVAELGPDKAVAPSLSWCDDGDIMDEYRFSCPPTMLDLLVNERYLDGCMVEEDDFGEGDGDEEESREKWLWREGEPPPAASEWRKWSFPRPDGYTTSVDLSDPHTPSLTFTKSKTPKLAKRRTKQPSITAYFKMTHSLSRIGRLPRLATDDSSGTDSEAKWVEDTDEVFVYCAETGRSKGQPPITKYLSQTQRRPATTGKVCPISEYVAQHHRLQTLEQQQNPVNDDTGVELCVPLLPLPAGGEDESMMTLLKSFTWKPRGMEADTVSG